MKSDRKQLITTLGCFLAVVAVGSALLVWPVRKQAGAIRVETADLLAQVTDLTGTAQHVKQLRLELERAQARMTEEFKVVPPTPAPDIMSRLSLHVDGQFVQDWSLTQGMPQSASTDEAVSAKVVPWTAEIKSRFEAVFDVLRVAETMQDLVRVSSVRLSSAGSGRQRVDPGRSRATEPGETPMVTAAIVFEAVYDPGKEQP